ncbi:hypothetical protein SteCoe_34299 [Stentor coeruleus]|uniref:Uncharacterized protein n=1 Tax=Stentor coeruleus TaxID=5963 RepID=A0A1R2AV74_9CILI|nr:hypothetical protein SteCoe_34299 [Stentor coeruleus]
MKEAILTNLEFQCNPLKSIPETTKGTNTISLNRFTRKKYQDIKDLYSPLLSVLCINCQEMIPGELIETHSGKCVFVTQTVQKIENTHSIDEWIFKIQKLKICLEDVIKKPEAKPCDKNTLIIMIRIIDATLANHSEEMLNNSTRSLNALSNNFKASLSIRVYLDRLQSLMVSLLIITQSENRLNAVDIETALIEKTKEINDLKIKTEYFKAQSDALEDAIVYSNRVINPMGKIIDDIDSEVGSRISSNSRISTLQNEFNSSLQEEMRLSNFEKNNLNEDDLQKYFYSLCLSLKIKYSTKDKIKSRLSNQKLYNEVIKLGIPTEEWYSFISNQFEDPDSKFIEGPPRRNTKIKVKQIFEHIIEEPI